MYFVNVVFPLGSRDLAASVLTVDYHTCLEHHARNTCVQEIQEN